MNASYAMNVVSETHDAWKELVISKNGNVVLVRLLLPSRRVVSGVHACRSRGSCRRSPGTSHLPLALTPSATQVRS